MLDPRIGRWFKMDAEYSKLPNLSPYGYVNNNPLLFLDPDGNFLIDVHKRITKNAFGKSTMRLYNSKNLSQYRSAIYGTGDLYSGSVVAPDVRTLSGWYGGDGKESISKEHFDSMSFKDIVENKKTINNKVGSLIKQYRSGNISAKELGNQIGESFHAVQDLYSHSNYIELYEEIYKQTDVNEIPTFEEAMSSKKFKRFADSLKKNLKTGLYDGKFQGKGSHKDMNHDLGYGSRFSALDEVSDKKVNWNSKAAKAVATKATIQLNNEVEANIK